MSNQGMETTMSNLRNILAQEGLIKTAKVTLATVRRINDMTDRNDHTGSAIALCEALGMKREAKVMGHVKAIQAIYGSMPYDLGKFRSNSVMPLVYKRAKDLQMPDGRSLYDHLD